MKRILPSLAALAALALSFSSCPPPDPSTITPVISSALPADGGGGARPDSCIVIRFSKAMDRASVEGAFSTAPVLSGTTYWNEAGTQFAFIPAAGLAAGGTYSYALDASAVDTYGLALEAGAAASFVVAQADPALDILGGKITGVSAAMQYSLDGGATWVGCGGPVVSGLVFAEGDSVYVRDAVEDAVPTFIGDVVMTAGPDLVAGRFYVGTGNWSDRSIGAPGDTLSIMTEDVNIGNSTSGAYTDQYWLSTDKVADMGDTLLKSVAVDSCMSGTSWPSVVATTFTVPDVDAGIYYILRKVDSENAVGELCEDNNVTRPENAVPFVVGEAPAASGGAVKIVNSWGKGGWEKVADGHYWATYDFLKQQQMPVYYSFNVAVPYKPTVLLVMKITHDERAKVLLAAGIGPSSSSLTMSKYLLARSAYWDGSQDVEEQFCGDLPFADDRMVFDISEFAAGINAQNLYVNFDNVSALAGSLDYLAVEFYLPGATSPFRTVTGPTGPLGAGLSVTKTLYTEGALTAAQQGAIAPAPRALAGGVSFSSAAPAADELAADMARVGVREPGKKYAYAVRGGYMVGAAPPSAAEWGLIRKLRSFSAGSKALPLSFDNSATIWFPPIGNQGTEGSCSAWAAGYYMHGFQMARENGWDLSAIGFSGTGIGTPTGGTDKLMSPDFLFHNADSGTNDGSSLFTIISFINQTGCAAWAEMPYTEQDWTAWPTEAAWRSAARFREGGAGALYWGDLPYADGCGYFIIKTDADVAMLKSLLAAGYCVTTTIWAGGASDNGIFDYLDAHDVVAAASTYLGAPLPTDRVAYPFNHAQTIVGYKEGVDWHPDDPEN